MQLSTHVIRDVQKLDGDPYVIAVRESAEPDSWSLLLMAADSEGDAQDLALGMDSYCIVVDPGQATFYGGIRQCEMAEERLSLVLTPDAATTLGLEVMSSFALEISADQKATLRQGLHRVLSSGRQSQRPILFPG